MFEPVLTRNCGLPRSETIDVYMANGGYQALPKVLREGTPHQIIEGVIIAGYAVGAKRAFVYIRGEFFLGVKRWIKAIDDAYAKGFLGKNILGSSFSMDLSVPPGAG